MCVLQGPSNLADLNVRLQPQRFLSWTESGSSSEGDANIADCPKPDYFRVGKVPAGHPETDPPPPPGWKTTPHSHHPEYIEMQSHQVLSSTSFSDLYFQKATTTFNVMLAHEIL